jgi:hypothetical protein
VQLAFVEFGDCKSPSSTATIDLNNISKNVSDTIMNSVTEQASKTVVVQKQNVIITGSCCSEIEINQNTNLKVVDTTQINSEMVSNILNNMKEQYNSELNKIEPNITEIMGDNIGKNVTTTIQQSIEKAIQNTSVQNSLKQNLKKTIGSQTQNINIQCSEYLPTPSTNENAKTVCKIDQSFLLQQTINNTFEDIFKQVSVDPNVIDSINSYTEKRLTEIGKPLNEIDTNQLKPIEIWWKNSTVYTIVGFVFFILLLRIIVRLIK